MNFSIYYPMKDEKLEVMRINGSIPELGSWNKGVGSIDMEKGPLKTWLTGEKIRPWVFKLRLSSVRTPTKIIYKYSVENKLTNVCVWEREPSRVLHI